MARAVDDAVFRQDLNGIPIMNRNVTGTGSTIHLYINPQYIIILFNKRYLSLQSS